MDYNTLQRENQRLRFELEQAQRTINAIRRTVLQLDSDYRHLVQPLTDREIEIIELIAAGNSTKKIANILNRSPYTIESHRGNIMSKLGINNMAELVVLAAKAGIV